MREFKFKGYGATSPFYGEGKFTIGEVYEVIEVEHSGYRVPVIVYCRDDRGMFMWEDISYFEEVTNDE